MLDRNRPPSRGSVDLPADSPSGRGPTATHSTPAHRPLLSRPRAAAYAFRVGASFETSCVMRNKPAAAALRDLLLRARYEVLPTASCEAAVVEYLPPGFTVTITASPSKGLDATLDLAERLARNGFDAVPHLAARMVSGRSELAEIAERLRAAGINTVFVP